MTMSQSNAYSECAVYWAIDGRDHRHFDTDDFSRTFVPSRRILSNPAGVKKSKPSGEIWAAEFIARPRSG